MGQSNSLSLLESLSHFLFAARAVQFICRVGPKLPPANRAVIFVVSLNSLGDFFLFFICRVGPKLPPANRAVIFVVSLNTLGDLFLFSFLATTFR